jgi:TonB family protein
MSSLRINILRGAALFGALLANSLSAQNVLVVEHHGKPAIVRAARDTRPIVIENEKRVVADGSRYGLHPVGSIFPVFVAVRNFEVKTTAIELMDSGNTINHQLELNGEFISQTELKDVFLVLELDMEGGGKSILLQEIGDLHARQERWLRLAFRTGFDLGKGTCLFHLFTEGVEVLSSMQPFEYREHLLDEFIAKKAAGRPDGPPSPFVCPAPAYPAALAKKKVPGHVVVKVRIRQTGAVLDPTVVEASDPAFGEAAIEALRVWRFIPAIKNGHPVEITASLPLDFSPDDSPPAASNGK